VITIVCLGDSTTAGTPGFRSPLEAPPDGAGNVQSQYAYWMSERHPDWRVLNRGVNGERSDEIRARFDRDVLAEKRGHASLDLFAAVIIAGVNDIYQGRSPESVEHELQLIYDAAQSAGVPVVAGSILPYNTATAAQNERMHAVNTWIREYAAARPRIVFCDTRAAVASAASIDALASSPDGLHPSPDGYRALALALETAIFRLL